MHVKIAFGLQKAHALSFTGHTVPALSSNTHDIQYTHSQVLEHLEHLDSESSQRAPNLALTFITLSLSLKVIQDQSESNREG